MKRRTPRICPSRTLAFPPWQRGAFRPLIETIFPYPCLACSQRQAVNQLGLCRNCLPGVRRTRRSSCSTCGRPNLRAGQRLCGACSARPLFEKTTDPPGPFAFDRLLTAFEYSAPFDAVIHAFKFKRHRFLSQPLARALWLEHAEDLAGFDVLIPIPLTPWRELRRGFNQSEALCRALEPLVQTPTLAALYRRQGPQQSTLPLARRRLNAQRLFGVRKSQRGHLRGAHVLLIDDVSTSGSTLRQAARLLRRAGATRVRAVAVARTP